MSSQTVFAAGYRRILEGCCCKDMITNVAHVISAVEVIYRFYLYRTDAGNPTP